MYVLAPNQTVEKFPYTVGDLKKDNPQTSFPHAPSDALLAEHHVYPVANTQPGHNPNTQIAEPAGCVYNDALSRWETAWTVRDLTAEELATRRAEEIEQIRAARAAAYAAQTDALFFKAQRGEATMGEWSAKVEEIRQQYPYPS